MRCTVHRCLSLASFVLVLVMPGSATAARYLVVAPGSSTAEAQAAVRANGGAVVDAMDAIGVVVAEAEGDAFASAVASSPGVLSVDPDPDVAWVPEHEAVVQADLREVAPGLEGSGDAAALAAIGPNAETYSSLQWNLRQIHADATAAAGYLGAGARVAVIDSGVNTRHRDLRDRIDFAASKAFVTSTLASVTGYAFEDDVGHGSRVACVLAASINGFGVQGVAPEARIVAIKATTGAAGTTSIGTLVRAIEYAASVGVDVINMSLVRVLDRRNAGGNGGEEPLGHQLAALTRAIDHAAASGALVVSAVGNQGVDLNGRLFAIPAQLGSGVAASATGPVANQDFDRLASYSNYGASVVTYAAPGGDNTLFPQLTPFPWMNDMLPSCGSMNPVTRKPDTFFLVMGTSFAAPHVSGIAALLVGKYGHIGPARLKELIGASAANVLPTAFQGRGRVDAWAALR